MSTPASVGTKTIPNQVFDNNPRIDWVLETPSCKPSCRDKADSYREQVRASPMQQSRHGVVYACC
jgi:hypothetical protein